MLSPRTEQQRSPAYGHEQATPVLRNNALTAISGFLTGSPCRYGRHHALLHRVWLLRVRSSSRTEQDVLAANGTTCSHRERISTRSLERMVRQAHRARNRSCLNNSLTEYVIPAKASVDPIYRCTPWTPACAGVWTIHVLPSPIGSYSSRLLHELSLLVIGTDLMGTGGQ